MVSDEGNVSLAADLSICGGDQLDLSIVGDIGYYYTFSILALLQVIGQSDRHIAFKDDLLIVYRQIEVIDRFIADELLRLIVNIRDDLVADAVVKLIGGEVHLVPLLTELVYDTAVDLDRSVFKIDLKVIILCAVKRILIDARRSFIRVINYHLG